MSKPFAITLNIGSSLANHTGSWRSERPVYVNWMPPCNNACPAGEDVQGWLYEGESGNYEQAWRNLVRDNPFPAIMGRICYHPCQSACNRADVDEAVGINSVERFLGDQAIDKGWQFVPPTVKSGRRILVVGSGPSGLSAAYHLAMKGHEVVIRESAAEPGGMMRYGIPAYRLPREVLDAEISRLVNLGVRIECNTKVENPESALESGFDALAVIGVLRAVEEFQAVAFFEAAGGQVIVEPLLGVAVLGEDNDPLLVPLAFGPEHVFQPRQKLVRLAVELRGGVSSPQHLRGIRRARG